VVIRRRMRAAGVAPSIRADVLPRLIEVKVRLPAVPGLKKEKSVTIRSRVRRKRTRK
jgi:hypothetical protein